MFKIFSDYREHTVGLFLSMVLAIAFTGLTNDFFLISLIIAAPLAAVITFAFIPVLYFIENKYSH